ncbi:MAG: hypothetical protein FWD73_11065 [Polyangiaceae bacterium]|nr:hypothetical protein [Polyangiaceae bacterium]
MILPTITFEPPRPPPSWVATEIAQPALPGAGGSSFSSWVAQRSEDGQHTLVAGCVATPIPGWVEPMRRPAMARTTGLILATAERIVASPVVVTSDTGNVLELTVAGSPAGTRASAYARRFIAFGDSAANDNEHKIFTCYFVCGSKAADAKPLDACAEIAARAELRGGALPPAPGLALSTIAWLVHHARQTVLGGGAVVATAGLLAIVTRRKPRARI